MDKKISHTRQNLKKKAETNRKKNQEKIYTETVKEDEKQIRNPYVTPQ